MRKFLIIPSLLILGAFPALAQDCPDLIEADCGGGTAWFGLRHDGANVGQGHTRHPSLRRHGGQRGIHFCCFRESQWRRSLDGGRG